MAPSALMMSDEHMSEPVSRTFQYRKYMKPMLERKRRARINRCLDELKELMTGALQNTDNESVTKLEKADILELTVRHLHNLRRQNKLYATASAAYAERFRQGFTHCAAEVSQFLNKIDQNANAHLMRHLRDCMQRCELIPPPPQLAVPVPLVRISSPPLVASDISTHILAKEYSFNGGSSPFLKSDVSVNNNYLSNYNNQNTPIMDTTNTRAVVIKCDNVTNSNSNSEINFWPETNNRQQSISPKNMSKSENDNVWRPW